jgi:hypothetical protein
VDPTPLTIVYKTAAEVMEREEEVEAPKEG